MSILTWLMEWYKSNCDGDWEHQFGIRIETVDNPGWHIFIDLENTPLENKCFREISEDNGDDDWFFCHVNLTKEHQFYAAGDPDKLEKMLEIFKKWAESE